MFEAFGVMEIKIEGLISDRKSGLFYNYCRDKR